MEKNPSNPEALRQMLALDTARDVANHVTTVLLIVFLYTGPVAAAKSAGELDIMQAILRIQEFARNVSYILGPALIIIGAAFYFFSSSNRRRSARGYKMMFGGVALFLIAIALDTFLNLIAWIAP